MSFWNLALKKENAFKGIIKSNSITYSATNSTRATEKRDTLKFKEMFSFLIGLQITKARLLSCKHDL